MWGPHCGRVAGRLVGALTIDFTPLHPTEVEQNVLVISLSRMCVKRVASAGTINQA